jgi:hypothetical protein
MYSLDMAFPFVAAVAYRATPVIPAVGRSWRLTRRPRVHGTGATAR